MLGRRNWRIPLGLATMMLLTGCDGVSRIGAIFDPPPEDVGCEIYRSARLNTPPVTASGPFLRWFNATDASMLEGCKNV